MPSVNEPPAPLSPDWNVLDEEDDFMEEDEILEPPDDFPMPARLADSVSTWHTLIELVEMMDNNRLDLDPSYQRNEVWPEQKQLTLVDSLARNFGIGSIRVAVRKDEESGETVMRVLDGKQRLSTIRHFIKGTLPYKDQNQRSWYFTSPRGGRKSILSSEKQKIFGGTRVQLDAHHGLTDPQEHEMFQRLQLSMQLTEGEKLSAISSQRSDYISHVVDCFVAVEATKNVPDPPQGERLRAYFPFDTKRGRPFYIMAYLAYTLEGIAKHERWHPTKQSINPWLNQDMDLPQPLKKDLEASLVALHEVAADPTLHKEAALDMERKVAPVELMVMGILMHVMRHATALERAQAIKGLRLMLSDKHAGQIRLNQTVMKNSWEYVETTVKGTEDEGNVPAAEPNARNKRPKPKSQRDRLDSAPSTNTPPTTPRKKRSQAVSTPELSSSKRAYVIVNDEDDNGDGSTSLPSPSKRKRLD